jgi:hypothetical protein
MICLAFEDNTCYFSVQVNLYLPKSGSQSAALFFENEPAAYPAGRLSREVHSSKRSKSAQTDALNALESTLTKPIILNELPYQ